MIPADTVLLRKVYGDASLATSASAFHIALGIDENYARCMGVLLVSLLAANPDTPLIFHVLTESIKPEDLQRISSLTENRRTTITLYYINKSALAELPASGHYSTAVYYRIVMPSILRQPDRPGSLPRQRYHLSGQPGAAGRPRPERQSCRGGAGRPRVVVEKVVKLKLQSQTLLIQFRRNVD